MMKMLINNKDLLLLIDILYEKKIPIMITQILIIKILIFKKIKDPYKRTISRLFELTSPKFKIN